MRELPGIQSKIDLTAGYSHQDFATEYQSYRAWALTTNIFGLNNVNPARHYSASVFGTQNRIISFYGRMTYSLKNKYILTLTVRRDGSSRFGPLNRWGTFPSAAFAWRIIDEGFMKNAQTIFSDLKLRAGYGLTGSQNALNDYGYVSKYSTSSNFAQYNLGGQDFNLLRPDAYNLALKWESTLQANLGLDFGFFNNRITGSIEAYRKSTYDLLFDINVPAGSNLSNRVQANYADLQNQGIELSLNTYPISTSKFSWNLGANAAYNEQTVKKIGGVVYTGGISGGTGTNVQILQVQKPVNSFYLYQHLYDSNGKPLGDRDNNGDGTIDNADIFADVNGDGIVNDNDRVIDKQPIPRVILGLTSSMNFFNFDFNFTLRSNLGQYSYNNTQAQLTALSQINNPFSPGNVLNEIRDVNFATPRVLSNYFLQNTSFMKLDNITLGYTIKTGQKASPEALQGNPVRRAVKSTIRIYATVQNALVVSGYTGINPEINGGIDNNVTPFARQYTFGLNVGF